jgi:hypothetical protein
MITEDTPEKKQGKFNKELSEKTELQTSPFDGPADGQGVELASPGRKHFFQIRPGKINKVWTTRLFDEDGEEVEYVIQADEDLRLRIFDKIDDNVSYKALVPCCNWYGTEFLWVPTIKPKGGSKLAAQTAQKAIGLGQKGWIKCVWKNNATGWVVRKYPGETDKKPEFSKMSYGDIIDQVFENKFIESLDHEALEEYRKPRSK